MENEIYNQVDLLDESEEDTAAENEELAANLIGEATSESCCNGGGANCLPNLEIGGEAKLNKLGANKIENSANNEATAQDPNDARAAIKKLIETLKPREIVSPEQRTVREAKDMARSMVNEINATGELSKATMTKLSEAYARAGRAGGEEGQANFMRQLNLAMQRSNMFMLHSIGETENGVTPHRIVVNYANGASFADGDFTSRVRQRKQ